MDSARYKTSGRLGFEATKVAIEICRFFIHRFAVASLGEAGWLCVTTAIPPASSINDYVAKIVVYAFF